MKTKYRIQKVTRIKDGTWYLPQKQVQILWFKWWTNVSEFMYRDEYKANEQIEIDSGVKIDKYETIKEFEL